MLISNGEITRNISPAQLPEYTAKGYAVVEEATAKPKAKAATKKGGE